MKKYILTLVLISVFFISEATTYYVSLTGNNVNSGLTEALAWRTLTYAMTSGSPVVAGDVIYVKGGNYANENIVVQKSGSNGSPIQIIGYTSVPGDVPPLLVNNANPYAAYTTTAMPTYTGTSRANGGICFEMRNRKYITIKNIQITAYGYGVITGGTTQTDYGNHTFYNVNMMSLGDLASSYDGRGFSIGNVDTSRSSYNHIQNCLIVNSKAEGITLSGNRNTVSGCKIYTNESGDATQYFVTIFGDENTVTYCHSEQATAIAVAGTHGYTIKSNAEKWRDAGLAYPHYNPKLNKIMYCTVRNINEGYCVRHEGVQYNLFYQSRANGTHPGTDASSGFGNGICIRDGASYNLFDGIVVDSCKSGIEFDDTVEDGGANTPNYNKIVNSTFSNCYTPIKFGIDGTVAGDAGINTIANCTFYLSRYLHFCARRCTSMIYIGNIYYGNSAVGSGGYFRGNTYSADVVVGQFTDCSSFNQQGGMPFALTYTVNPTFVDGPNRNFNLQSSSGLIHGNTNAATVTNVVPASQFATENNELSLFDINQYNTRNKEGIIRRSYAPLNVGAY